MLIPVALGLVAGPSAASATSDPAASIVVVTCTDALGQSIQGSGVSVPWAHSGVRPKQRVGRSLIVTAHHVIDGCTPGSLRVMTARGTSSPAIIRTTSPESDLASLTASVTVPPITLRTASVVPSLGSPATALGTAVTASFSRLTGPLEMATPSGLLVQVPASPGMSGGAVIDLDGRLIGITVATSTTATAAVALPRLCGTVYRWSWCTSPVWR